jgi:hypothetical protein
MIHSRDEAQPIWERISSAVEMFLAAGDVGSAVDVATMPIGTFAGSRGPAALLASLVDKVAPGSAEEARIQERLSLALVIESHDAVAARAATERCLKIAVRRSDKFQESAGLMQMALMYLAEANWDEALNYGGRAAALAAESGNLQAQVRALAWKAFATGCNAAPEDHMAAAKWRNESTIAYGCTWAQRISSLPTSTPE